MKVYVCIKHVPNTAAKITLEGSTAYDESVKFVVNPYDEFAVEEGLKLADGDDVVVVCVGKESAAGTMRASLAMGATRGILVTVGEQFISSGVTAQAIVKAIQADGEPMKLTRKGDRGAPHSTLPAMRITHRGQSMVLINPSRALVVLRLAEQIHRHQRNMICRAKIAQLY